MRYKFLKLYSPTSLVTPCNCELQTGWRSKRQHHISGNRGRIDLHRRNSELIRLVRKSGDVCGPVRYRYGDGAFDLEYDGRL